jgi:hypothetical protein
MKLMFNKKTYEGHWFDDDELDDNYTEVVPPGTNHIFDEDKNEWVREENNLTE